MALRSDCRVLSERHMVQFAGFVSDTYQLQRAGWQIAAREDFYGDSITLLLRHPESGLKLFTNSVSLRFLSYRGEAMRFTVVRAGTDLQFMRNDPIDIGPLDGPQFMQVDAKPQVVKNFEPKSIEDFGIFAAQLVRTEEILIEPQSVAECMEYIKKLQAPELAAIRERNRQRDRTRADEEPVLRQNFHAQILSIAA